MKKYTADFETTTDENDCRVWAFALCEIGNINNFIYGNNIEDFIKFCSNPKENYVLYFHNLKFDSEYIFNYLLNNGYEVIKDRKQRRDKTFTTLISDAGQFYSVEIFFHCTKKHTNKVVIYDSMKILNFSVDKIAKDFHLPIQKLDLDYNEYREVGHELTDHEIAYIRNDVEIMARALEYVFNENLMKMTIGSDALANYKEMNKSFKHYFPILPTEIDLDIRQSYKGGFTYLNETYVEKEVGKGLVLDMNSMYPYVMHEMYLPFGDPLFFDGQYEEDKLYKLYVQSFSCSFELKEGMIPTIQIKNNPSFVPNEYLKSSDGDIITLVLTNVDMELFFKHYNITSKITYHGGWKFKALKGLFSYYVDYWTERKIQAKKEENHVVYILSKLMLNSLYGKMGTNPKVRGKYPILTDEKIVKYKMYDEEIKDGIYIPCASFITSYARRRIIETSQAIKDYTINKYGIDYYIYSDTDSIHMLDMDENELAQFVEMDDYRLGAFKIESRFSRGRYLRQKCYIEENEEKLNVVVSGLPKKLHKYVNFDNFKKGMAILEKDKEKEHKLRYKHVKGGVLLVDTDFTIK